MNHEVADVCQQWELAAIYLQRVLFSVMHFTMRFVVLMEAMFILVVKERWSQMTIHIVKLI
ncbi:hypothetical protein ACG97_07905 [Vogesella sp. EB]|nr:hypothetical protein ACG97_07905 [Vogesella sp. EB]